MGIERPVKLYRDGAEQAVRIPHEFELPGEDAVMRKDGDRLIIEPGRKEPKGSVTELLASWAPIEEEFPLIPDLPAEPIGKF